MARAPTIETVWPGNGRKPFRKSEIAPRVATGSFGLVQDARSEKNRIEINLPSHPPATNNLYFNVAGKGRVRSDRYNQWLDESAWMILAQKPGRIGGKFTAEITVKRPDNRRRDIDGLLKPILDCCVKNRIVTDDHLAESVRISWASDGEAVKIVLTKYEGIAP